MLAGDYLPLYSPLVKGRDFSALVDTGTKALYPQLVSMIEDAGMKPADLRMVIQTHSHADHLGCNVKLKKLTGCLIAGHPGYAHWHYDLERHYQEWARPIPELIPDTAELRQGLLDWFDEPHHLDIHTDEGTVVDLGGGVTLRSFFFPGHMLNDMGWLETSTRTMILGDGITATTWPHFHMHLTVPGYRTTLNKLRAVFRDHKVETVFMTHFGPMPASDALHMADLAEAFLLKMDRELLRVMTSAERVTLETIWGNVAEAMDKARDFQALNTIFAHVKDFQARGLIREVEPRVYSLA